MPNEPPPSDLTCLFIPDVSTALTLVKVRKQSFQHDIRKQLTSQSSAIACEHSHVDLLTSRISPPAHPNASHSFLEQAEPKTPKLASRRKHPNMLVHTTRRNHTANLHVRTSSSSSAPSPGALPPHAIDLHAVAAPLSIRQLRAPIHARRPPHLGHKMLVRAVDDLDALAVLREVPAAQRLVVAARQQVLAARVEEQGADPVVVAGQRLDQRAATVPQLDGLVARARGDEFGRAAGGRRAAQAGEGGEVLVGGWRRHGDALDDVLVAEELGFLFARAGVSKARRLVVAAGEEPAAVEGGRHVADPVAVAADRLDTVARRDVPYSQRAVPARGDEEVPALWAACRAARDESNRRHAVVVPWQRPRVLILI